MHLRVQFVEISANPVVFDNLSTVQRRVVKCTEQDGGHFQQ